MILSKERKTCTHSLMDTDIKNVESVEETIQLTCEEINEAVLVIANAIVAGINNMPDKKNKVIFVKSFCDHLLPFHPDHKRLLRYRDLCSELLDKNKITKRDISDLLTLFRQLIVNLTKRLKHSERSE